MTKIFGLISIIGVIVFSTIIVYLHIVQVGYDPKYQLISELALGANGNLMPMAFLALAVALVALTADPSFSRSLSLKITISFAAICFFGAGVFPLGTSSEIHIALVAISFIASGVAMYLLPLQISWIKTRIYYSLSWGFLIAMASSLALGYAPQGCHGLLILQIGALPA